MEARAEAGEQRPGDELGLGIQNAELNQMFAEDDLARAMLNGGATAPLPLPSASPGQHAGSSSIGSKDDQFAAYHEAKEEAEANVRRRIRDGTYKTEMCPSGQDCPLRRGRSCAFAHSVEELQERVRTAGCVRSLLIKPVCLHSTYSTPSQHMPSVSPHPNHSALCMQVQDSALHKLRGRGPLQVWQEVQLCSRKSRAAIREDSRRTADR